MADRIQKIVTNLRGLKSVTDVWKTADRSLKRGDAAFVADLAVALAGAYASDAGRTWQYRSVFDYLLRLPATTPGPGNVAQALRPVSSAETAGRKLDRCTASLPASSQPAEELAVAFTGHATEELRACLVHEPVLRGVDVTGSPGIAGWATSPHWSHHPLGWLPLTLSDVEGQPDLPSCSARGGSHTMGSKPPGVCLQLRIPECQDLDLVRVRRDGGAQFPNLVRPPPTEFPLGLFEASVNPLVA